MRSRLQGLLNRGAPGKRFHRAPGSILNQAARYWRVLSPYATPRKVANALLCHAEMALRRPVIRSTPYILRIEATNTCNLRCPGCATGLRINPTPKGFLAPEELRRVLDAVAPNLLITRLDGLGEPLLHPQIADLIALAHDRGSATAISTHFGEKTLAAGQARRLVEAGLDYIIVSIDGPDQESYEKYRVGGRLETVKEHVRELVAARAAARRSNPLIEVQFIGFDHNRHLADRMPALAESLGADRLLLKMVHPEAHRERRAADYEGHPCFFQYTTWTIGWNGVRKLCVNAWGDTEPMQPSFRPEADLMGRDRNEPYLVALRRFLAGNRDMTRLEPILGDPKSRDLSYRVPRGPGLCRCLNCATTGMVVDRNRAWLDDYICT
ncbi:MAG TPA: radical SAM protein [Candidatus Polarisedimenticolia bacterium]|nr:radical SAM protein [Candidatus Polarisedimenticolia bacterium]